MARIKTTLIPRQSVLGNELKIKVRPGGISEQSVIRLVEAAGAGDGGGVDTDCLLLLHTSFVNNSVVFTVTDINGTPVEGVSVSLEECS